VGCVVAEGAYLREWQPALLAVSKDNDKEMTTLTVKEMKP
jgi:hypothetical protein